MSWENILKRKLNFSVGDVVTPNFYDTRYPVNDPRRIIDGAMYLVVSIEGDRIRVEQIHHPDDPRTPIEETQLARKFDYYSDYEDTSERDAERAFESRLYGGKRHRSHVEEDEY